MRLWHCFRTYTLIEFLAQLAEVKEVVGRKLSACVCLCANHGGTNYNHFTHSVSQKSNPLKLFAIFSLRISKFP